MTATASSPAFRKVLEPYGYWLGDVELPSPSKVFQDLGLVDTRWYTEEHRARGHAVHGYMHYLLKGTLDWASVDVALVGYVTSGMKLLERLGWPRMVRAETPLYHPELGFAGTYDVEWEHRGTFWIIDWKSGRAPKVAQYQTACYASLAARVKNGVGPFYRRAAVELFEDGSIANIVQHNDATDTQGWLNLLGAYRIRRQFRAQELAVLPQGD